MKVETSAEGDITRQASGRLVVRTHGPGFTDLTDPIAAWLARLEVADGLLTVFCRHTSASLTIQENADPDVRQDLLTALARLAPRDGPWRHTLEGPDDLPAHIKAMLTSTSLVVPIQARKPGLGTWQAIYLVEHREGGHSREVLLHALGA